MEHWIVFDLASGEARWRGSGPYGAAAAQPLPEGLGVVIVPQAVVASPTDDLDLASLRAALINSVDMQAEQRRSLYITALPGQVGAYWLKEAVARRWLADNAVSTAALQPEATARGMTIAELAAEVIANAEAWELLSGVIEGVRFTAKVGIDTASNIGGIVQAATLDWSDLDAPAA